MMQASGVGRLVRDPELKYVGNDNTAICEFSLAINEFRKIGGERKKFAHFFDFVVWAQAAETIAQYCKQGDLLEFYATPRQDRWEDKDSGSKRSKVIFRINDFRMWPRGEKPEVDAESESEEEPF